MSVMNVIACVFMPWYEGWGTADSFESGDYFDGMLANMDVNTIIGAIQTGLYILTAVCAVACVVLFFISKKVEPAKEK